MTERIVLNLNLKFILASLTVVQRGELLTALFDENFQCTDNVVKNIHQYIASLQEDAANKRQKMKDLSAKGVAARVKKETPDEPSVDRTVDRTINRNLQRKETKENNNVNNNLNLFSFEPENNFVKKKRQHAEEKFIKPDVEEVRAFIEKNQLKVDAQRFVDFYEARGWKFGSVVMNSWQAVLRLWHARAGDYEKQNQKTCRDDESYWHELSEKFMKPPEKQSCLNTDRQKTTDILATETSIGVCRQLSFEQREKTDVNLDEQPFTRFMHRIEKFDIQAENEHDRK